MQLLVSSLLLLLAILALVGQGHDIGFEPEDLSSEQSIRALFEQWCIKHAKSYPSESEKQFRYDIFKRSLEEAHAHNNQLPPPSYLKGLNAFSDITNDEFHAGSEAIVAKPNIPGNKIRLASRIGSGNAPASVDWRTKGAVTSVKDTRKANCTGGAWAFAVAGSVEAINQITTGQLVDLSAQQVLDCSRDYTKKATPCAGAAPQYGLSYLSESAPGLFSEAAYPFTGQNVTCQKKVQGYIVSVDGVDNLWSESDESEIVEKVAEQPVTALVSGNSSDFKSYSKGIFTGNCDENLSTGVLIVGYGTENGKDYWIIKNSWGSSWGENGYMRLQRGVGKCGINSFIYYPTKEAHPSETVQQGLVGWWKLDEKFGNVATDSSASQTPGIISGGAAFSGGSLYFNGGGKVFFGSKASLCGKTSFSLSVRIKTSMRWAGVVMQQRSTWSRTTDGYNGQYQLFVTDGKPWFWVYGNNDLQWRFCGQSRVNDNRWHHIVAVRDGKEGRLYVDGVLSGSAIGDLKDLSSSIPVYLGGDYRLNKYRFVGAMASVRIYNRVLTDQEIKLLSTLQV